jgi:hypothetical protein
MTFRIPGLGKLSKAVCKGSRCNAQWREIGAHWVRAMTQLTLSGLSPRRDVETLGQRIELGDFVKPTRRRASQRFLSVNAPAFVVIDRERYLKAIGFVAR